MKNILYALIIILSISCKTTGETSNKKQNLPPAHVNINTLPLYGGYDKTEDQQEADRKFVTTVIEEAGSREAAVSHFLKRGWEYLWNGDLETAVMRFNQVWLLDSENYEAYWGLAISQLMENKYEEGLLLLNQANSLNSFDGDLSFDTGLAYTRYANTLRNNEPDNTEQIREAENKALEYFMNAEMWGHRSPALYNNWAALYIKNNQLSLAERVIQNASSQGIEVDPLLINYLNELSSDTDE